MRLIELRFVSIVRLAHADDIYAVVSTCRCDQFCEDHRLVPISNLGELRRYAVCRFVRDLDAGTLAISQQPFAANTAPNLDVRSGRRTSLPNGLKLEELTLTNPRATGRSRAGRVRRVANGGLRLSTYGRQTPCRFSHQTVVRIVLQNAHVWLPTGSWE